MKELLEKCGADENDEEKDNLPKDHDGHRVVNDYFNRGFPGVIRVIRYRTPFILGNPTCAGFKSVRRTKKSVRST